MALAASLVLAGAGGLWAHSYGLNHQRLMRLAELTQPLSPADAGLDATLALLPLLDSRLAAMRLFPAAQDSQWHERAGLYQGEPSRPLLTRAYAEALHQQLLPLLTALLEEQVRADLGIARRCRTACAPT